MAKPEYRFNCEIIDDATGSVVVSGSTFLSEISDDGECESVDMEVGSILRGFKKRFKAEHEADNYAEAVNEED